MLDAGSGYFPYLWSDGTNTRYDTIYTSGTYTVTVSLGVCMGTATKSVSMNPSPSPVITPFRPATFCNGETDSLIADGGYFEYLWSTGETTESISVRKDTLITLRVRNNYGCYGDTSIVFFIGVETQQYKIIAKANRTNTNILICPDCHFENYIWGYESKTGPVDSSVSCHWTLNYCYYDRLDTFNYYYWLYDGDSSSNCSNKIYYNPPPGLKIANDKPSIETTISIYPNPNNGIFTLHISDNTATFFSLMITDILGQQVDVESGTFDKSNNKDFQIKNPRSGLYFIQVTIGENTFYRKLIIE